MGMVDITKRNVSRIIAVSWRIIGYASNRIINRIKKSPCKGDLIRIDTGRGFWGGYVS